MSNNYSLQDVLLGQINIPTILLSSYKSLGLHEYDVMVLLQIHRFQHELNEFPTPAEIASYLTITEAQCIEILRKLMERNYLAIIQQKNEQGILSEIYSLDPLWQQLFAQKQSKEDDEGAIFILFEQEFGRPLSPFEIETINVWLDEDEMKPALIKAALRESVLMSKLNFKYIDRILREWKRKGIHSVEQAREEGKSFRQHQVKKQYNVETRDTSVYFNWLEGE
ncbi:MAG TPA: DnaD domain-containing protein [Pseudogracilibacillus sp.]|nr:DnaD domain-containing protein [Pseudogracilibacillus sp.]